MSIYKKIGNFIKTFDMISRKPQMRIDDRKRNATELGGFLSILIYGLIALSLGYFGQEMYMKRYPLVSRTDELVLYSDKQVTINNDTIWVVFLFKDENGNYLSNTNVNMINVNAYMIETNNTASNTKEVTSQLKKCNESQMLSAFADDPFTIYQISYIISSSFCIIGSYEAPLEINSIVNSEYHYTKSLNFKIQIQGNGDIAGVEILYSKYAHDDNDYMNVDKYYFSKYEASIQENIKKKITFYLTSTNLQTDMGLIFTDYRLDSLVTVDKITEDFTLIDNVTGIKSFELGFNLSTVKTVYYRQYLKLQSLLAEVGGISKAFLIIAWCLNTVHNNSRFYETLINELFNVKDLRKNFQFYETKTKHYFKKYRNSIALKRVKDFEFVKRDQSRDASNLSMPLRVNNLTRVDLSNMKKFPTVRLNNNDFLSKEGIMTTAMPENNNDIAINADNGVNVVHSSWNNMMEQEESHAEIYNVMCSQNVSQRNQIPTPARNQDQLSKGKKDNVSNYFNQENLKSNRVFKDNFDKVKHEQFSLKLKDICKLKLCWKSDATKVKKNILESGKLLINQRLDVVNMLKKMLDFDRFKNLVLKDYQLVLLNSLSKFLLDPETINLVEFKNISFDKLVDSIVKTNNSNSVIDYNLREFVKLKYELDLE